MTFRLRRVAPLVLALSLLTALFVAPAVARADSLSWTLKYSGPPNISGYPNPDIPVAGAFNAVSFSDQMTGWAVGARLTNVNPQSPSINATGFVAVTHDGGQHWGPVGTPAGLKQLYGVDAVAATDVWVVGYAGTVAHWDGTQWTTRTLSSAWGTKVARGVAFADADHGWIVGDGGGIAYTSNGGDTWADVVVPGTGQALNAIAMVDATTAIAVGNSGTMRRLVGGAAPEVVSSGTSQHLNAVAFGAGGRGIVAGANATARRTINGGGAWTTVSLDLPASYIPSQITARAVALAGSDNAVITGTYQTVWRSFDSGASWTVERLSDATSDGTLELRGVGFVGGSADAPCTVGRAYGLAMNSSDNKARAYLGSWTGRVLPPPTAPSAVTLQRATPGPKIRVDWTDASADEDGFVVQRAKDSTSDGAFSTVATLDAGVTSWTDASADWDSTWYYRVRSYRDELVSTWAVSAGFVVDALAPTTTSNAKDLYIVEAPITLTAQDEANGSGIARTYYTIDTASRTGAHQGTSFVVTGLGEHTIRFWSEDVAGNVENPGGEFTFTINPTPPDPDLDAPVTTTDIAGSHEGSVTVRLEATDTGGTGVAATWYTFNGGSPIRYTVPFPVSAPHDYTMTYWSEDAAGNEEEHRVATFTVSAMTPPTTACTVYPYYANSARFTLTATDGPTGSGVERTYYRVDGGAAVIGTSVYVTGARAHTLEYWSVDALGNTEPATKKSFTIAATPSSKGTPTIPSAIPTLRHGATFTTVGFMKRYSRTYAVKLYFYRYKSGHWVYYRSVTAKNYLLSPFLRYSLTTSVPYSGKWKVRARRVVGSTVRYSPYEYFTAN